MLFDTIQNKHKPYSFSSLLKTRLISVLVTLLIHGIVLFLVLFVIPLVQVNIFDTEVVDVFIAPFDPLILPSSSNIYGEGEEIETAVTEEKNIADIMEESGTGKISPISKDEGQEKTVSSVQTDSEPSSPLISEFRLDKKTDSDSGSDQAKRRYLIFFPPESGRILPEKIEMPGKELDFNKYLRPEFPRTDASAKKRHLGIGSGGRQAQAIIKGAQFDVTPWASVVVERIQKNWIIPSDRENPAKGRVGIDVKISKKGELVEIRVVESSLIQSFDLAAIAAIKDSAPFPSLPSTYTGIVLEIYFIFQYND